ncbi:MAG: dihydrofolate reductase family protein [Chryseolinea sp.]
MRKVKLQVQISLDGFVAGPNSELDWLTFQWTDDINKYVAEITEPVDTIVLGRKLAEGFIPHWAGVAADPAGPEFSAGQKFTETKKIVFSRTLDQSEAAAKDWKNTIIVKEDLVDFISRLKKESGKDIIAYGGANFVSGLITENLIDEYHLLVNPAAISNGLPIFKDRKNLKFVKAQAFDCGIVAMVYVK